MGRSAKSTSPAIRATQTALPDRASANAQPTGPPPAMATSTSGGSSATTNQGLHIPDRFRCCCSQYLAPRGRYDNVVLDAHARVPEVRRAVGGGRDLAPGFAGQAHARLGAPPSPVRFVFPGVVDAQAEP